MLRHCYQVIPNVIPLKESDLTWTEFIALFKDFVLSVAAITGAIVAVKGLGTWQRQLKGQSEYELARRILVTLYKYRDRIDGVRYPGMWPHEMPFPSEDEAKKMSAEQIQSYGTSMAYQARWDKVQLERTSLNADLLEAEAIWGDELKNLFAKVFDLEFDLFICISQYAAIKYPDEASKETIRNIVKKKRDIRFDYLGGKPDDYKQDLIIAFENIEKYLKPKLIHKKV